MAGKIHAAIQEIITTRGKGNPVIERGTRTKLLLKGIDASKWTPVSPDDAAMLSRVMQAAADFGISISLNQERK
jgi:hypothetical protein